MMPPPNSTTRLTVAIFIAALFCASLCPMTCALSFCPAQSHDSPMQDCDHSAPADAAHRHAPAAPNCATHHGMASNLVKPAAPIQLHASPAREASADSFLINSAPVASLNKNARRFSSPTPPQDLSLPLDQQNLALRI